MRFSNRATSSTSETSCRVRLHRSAPHRHYYGPTPQPITSGAFSGCVHPDRRHFRFKEQPMSRRLTFVTFLVLFAAALPASAQVGKSANQPDRRKQRRPRDAADYVRRHRLSGSAGTLRRRCVHATSSIFVNGTYARYPRQLRWRHEPGGRVELAAPADPLAEPDVPERVDRQRLHVPGRRRRQRRARKPVSTDRSSASAR